MAAPPGIQEVRSITRIPLFNRKYDGQWKDRIRDFMEGKDLEFWDIVQKGPKVPMEKYDKWIVAGAKAIEQYNNKDVNVVQKNAKAKKN